MVIILAVLLIRQRKRDQVSPAPITPALTAANAPPNLWGPPPSRPLGYPPVAAGGAGGPTNTAGGGPDTSSRWPGLSQQPPYSPYSGMFIYSGGMPSALSRPTPGSPGGRLQPLPPSLVSGINLPYGTPYGSQQQMQGGLNLPPNSPHGGQQMAGGSYYGQQQLPQRGGSGGGSYAAQQGGGSGGSYYGQQQVQPGGGYGQGGHLGGSPLSPSRFAPQ